LQPLKKTKKLLLGPDLGARKKFECPVKNHVNRSLQLNRLLKDYFKTMRTLFLVLILALASVRSEYTWNGQEWVWSEDKNPSPPVDSYNEGSGEYNNFADEDEDDSNFNYDYEGSGNDDNDDEEDAIEDSYSPRQPTDNFQNSRNNYQDPYGGSNSWNNPEPKNPWDQNNFNQQQNNNFNSQYSPTQQPPYFGNEVETTDDIYVEPPQQNFPPTPSSTTAVPPRDPSISSRPKSPSRSTSFFAQPGTLAAVIGGAVVGLLCAILCVMFVVYRMRKKDEGSYALDEPKRSPTVNAYAKHPNSREFYA